ncbi:rhodanese-like domain-containing protein [Pseudooctadecabacter jejudonensis]|uniref:Molybdopterin biosynthesis protein MoeB n=1 Tax=Pseudooctadecabacter jejudonensis TaxID=1391910 RepID=A0A1Y5TDF0_9RHOB|nr:rhodanese-like domain-containing protein [Pseudooctadecabacter jejudonensis]SLN61659.1 molybdopterin biosynthesis protein MoeB [Pseudooctadecabacter jejudonensis]
MTNFRACMDAIVSSVVNAVVGSFIFFGLLAASGELLAGTAVPQRLAVDDVPKHAQFPLHNYISSIEAAELVAADPDILFVDVRDEAEIANFGRPLPVNAIVPVRIQSDTFNETLNEYVLVDNPDFLDQMATLLANRGQDRGTMILLTCGSGYRSAVAARILVDAGYTNVWHIPDGYDGDEKLGLNAQNAWQLAGLDWTYLPLESTAPMQPLSN